MTTQNQPRVHLRAEMYQLRDGKPVFRGDPFTAPPQEAEDLITLRYASKVVHPEDDSSRKPEADEPEGDSPNAPSRKPVLRRKPVLQQASPRYQRRDLRAEEDGGGEEKDD
jgi:hypothetical protein